MTRGQQILEEGVAKLAGERLLNDLEKQTPKDAFRDQGNSCRQRTDPNGFRSGNSGSDWRYARAIGKAAQE